MLFLELSSISRRKNKKIQALVNFYVFLIRVYSSLHGSLWDPLEGPNVEYDTDFSNWKDGQSGASEKQFRFDRKQWNSSEKLRKADQNLKIVPASIPRRQEDT